MKEIHSSELKLTEQSQTPENGLVSSEHRAALLVKPCKEKKRGVNDQTQLWRVEGNQEGGEEVEQYILTMATGTLLYFHLLIVIAATKKKKHK